MQLQAGQQLLLEKGMAQITYGNGAVVLLEGPASFRIDSPKSGFLARGKLMARADTEESRQFTIITPDARFEDLGTEFGVMIDDKGRSAVAVFAGKVKAEAKLADGRWTVPVSLGRGEAAFCEEAEFTRQVAQRNNFPTLQPQSQTPPRRPVPAMAGCQPGVAKPRGFAGVLRFPAGPEKCQGPVESRINRGGAKRRNTKCNLESRTVCREGSLGIHVGRRGRESDFCPASIDK